MRARREFEIVAAENLKILQAKAPKTLNGTVLEYLTLDYTHSEKAILPSFLPLLKVDANFQELIFRLKFVLSSLRVGPETTSTAGWLAYTQVELIKGLKLDKILAGEQYEQERKILRESCREVVL